jgi:hypothetical protein
MVNETLKTLRDPGGVHTEEVEQYEGYEHAHWAWRYRWEATRAGFMTEITEPCYKPFFGGGSPSPRGARAPLIGPVLRKLARVLQTSAVARRIYLVWLNHVQGTVQVNMIGTKPVLYGEARKGITVTRRLLPLTVAKAVSFVSAAKRSRWFTPGD